MEQLRKLGRILQKQSTVKMSVIAYILLSFVSVFMFYQSSNTYTLVGNHSIFYPYLGVFLAESMDSSVFAISMICWWVVSVVLFVVASFLFFVRKKVRLLQVAVFADAAFTFFFTGVNIYFNGFLPFHILMLLGGFFNCLFGRYLCLCRKSIDTKEE